MDISVCPLKKTKNTFTRHIIISSYIQKNNNLLSFRAVFNQL